MPVLDCSDLLAEADQVLEQWATDLLDNLELVIVD